MSQSFDVLIICGTWSSPIQLMMKSDVCHFVPFFTSQSVGLHSSGWYLMTPPACMVLPRPMSSKHATPCAMDRPFSRNFIPSSWNGYGRLRPHFRQLFLSHVCLQLGSPYA